MSRHAPHTRQGNVPLHPPTGPTVLFRIMKMWRRSDTTTGRERDAASLPVQHPPRETQHRVRTHQRPPRQRPLSQALWRITLGSGIPSLASVLQRTYCLSRGRTRQLCCTLITIISLSSSSSTSLLFCLVSPPLTISLRLTPHPHHIVNHGAQY